MQADVGRRFTNAPRRTKLNQNSRSVEICGVQIWTPHRLLEVISLEYSVRFVSNMLEQSKTVVVAASNEEEAYIKAFRVLENNSVKNNFFTAQWKAKEILKC